MSNDLPAIPDTSRFQHPGGGFCVAETIHNWSWSITFNRWGASVTFKDGIRCFTWPDRASHEISIA